MANYDNYNSEWVLSIARRLQLINKPIPEALQRRADKLGLDIRLFSDNSRCRPNRLGVIT
jgi:hypothetical protein